MKERDEVRRRGEEVGEGGRWRGFEQYFL